MKSLILTFFVFFLFLISSCRNSSNDEKKITFPHSSVYNITDDSTLLLNVEQIALSLNDNPIGAMSSAWLTDSSIFVFDFRNTQTVMKFNRNGEYQLSIGKLGGGPEEYQIALDFYIDVEKRTVEILTQLSLFIYDFDGAFKRKESIAELGAFAFSKDNASNYWLFSGNNKVLSDNKLHKIWNNNIESFLPVIEQALPMQERNLHKNVTGEISIFESLSNELHLINNGNVKQFAIVDFGVDKNILALKDYNDPMEYFQEIQKKEYYSVQKFFVNKDYIYLFVVVSNATNDGFSAFHWIIDRNSAEQSVLSSGSMNSEWFMFRPQQLTEKNELVFIGNSISQIENNDVNKQQEMSVWIVPISNLLSITNEF